MKPLGMPDAGNMQKPPSLQFIHNPNEIVLLLRAVIGTRTKLIDFQVVTHHQDYCVLLAQLDHPSMDVVIKLAGHKTQMAGQFDRTAAIHQLVAKSTTIPMPETIAVDVTFQRWPWRYLIRTHLPGIEWSASRHYMDESELACAFREIGEATGQLHQIAFPAFGEIDARGQVAHPDLTCLAALRRRAEKLIKSPQLLEGFLSALEQRSHWFEVVEDSRLCHEDLHGHNILFIRQSDQWRLATVLDFDKAWAGHAETDLARLEFWRGMTAPAFWEAYRTLQPLDDNYVHRRPVYQLLWCLEYASPTQQHLADTRRVFQELDLPVVATLSDRI